MKKVLGVLLSLVLSATLVMGAAGESSFYFLDIGMGGASTAMGKASVANPGTLEGMYGNPACIASQEEDLNIIVNFNPYMVGVDGEGLMNLYGGAASFKIPMPLDFHIGATFYGLSYGSITGNITDATSDGTALQSGDIAVNVAAGLSLALGETFTLDVGAGFKFVNSTLDTASLPGIGADIGAIATFGLNEKSELTAGLHLKNLGVGLPDTTAFTTQSVTLPMAVLVGVGYKIAFNETTYLKALVDADIHFESQINANIGVEVGLLDMLAIRAGAVVGTAGIENSMNLNITGGLGFKYPIPGTQIAPVIDYAFVYLGEVGMQHNIQVGMSMSLGEEDVSIDEPEEDTDEVVEPK